MLQAETVNQEVSLADFQKALTLMPEAMVKLQRKGQMVLPRSLREQAGISEGTLMKVALVEGGKILLTPQLTIDRRRHRPSQKPQGLRDLAKAVAEIRQDAKEKGLDKMPMSEINRAVAGARRDLKKKPRKQPAQ